ncbi:DUF2948 family protein [bacterium]|nr:DUF2948 family protein [bacterium]
MSEDARFEDGAEKPLRLKAETPEDLAVVAALVQDAVLPANEMRWVKSKRQFACFLNRFRWEDKPTAERRGRDFERVQAVLMISDVLSVSHQGIDARDADTVLSLLTLAFEPGEDGTGRLVLTLAGDGAVRLDVETLDVTLQDVTRPYRAPSRKAPSHPE